MAESVHSVSVCVYVMCVALSMHTGPYMQITVPLSLRVCSSQYYHRRQLQGQPQTAPTPPSLLSFIIIC